MEIIYNINYITIEVLNSTFVENSIRLKSL